MKSQQAATTGSQQQVNHQNQAPVAPQKSSHLLAGPSTHLKSSLSKLHNLVTAQLSPTPPRTAKLLAQHQASRYTQAQRTNMKPANNNAGRGTHSTVSEKIAPELAKCYDEIDQIYDYIRGLAPLPVQLRKIKSIDFEQLERDRRIVELQQHQQALQKQTQRQQQATQQRLPTYRQVMRESSGDETLVLSQREPTLPQPLRLTTCVAEGPPLPPVSSVKRVESLNLGSSHLRPAATVSGTKLQRSNPTQQALLITPLQRAPVNLFRLPRAHSTSTLNKPMPHPHINGRLLPASGGHPRAPAEQSQVNTRTLPALSISRRDPVARSSSLKRSASRQQQVCCEQQLKQHQQPGKPADFVESFVDGDDVSSVSSQLTSSRSSSSCSDASLASEHTKSHSDYDNDTASLSGSAATSNSFGKRTLGQHPKARRPSARRRSSSGGGRASSANHRLGSHSSSSGRPSSSSTAPAADNKLARPTTEHIYEQIPAHKLMVSGQQAAGSRIKQYPVMYAPNMALTTTTTTNTTAARMATCAIPNKLHSSSYPLPLRPNQQARQRAAPLAPPPNQPSATTTTSTTNHDHTPRLSLSNLHLIPFLAFGQSTATTRRPSNTESSSRPCPRGSGGGGGLSQPMFQLKSRAPPLSPAQLIAQCQMPRAVSKRRLQKPDEPASPELDSHSTAVWNKTSTDGACHPQREHSQHQQSSSFKWLRRDPSRRLTAIGIEQALECMKTAQNGLKDSSMLLNLEQSGRGKQVSATGDKLVPLAGEQRKHVSTGENRKQQQQSSRFLNSISDLHSFSSCSSSQSDTGSLPDQSEGCCNSIGDSRIHSPARQATSRRHRQSSSREPSDEWSSGGNFVSSRSFIKCYYGNEKENLVSGEEQFLPPVEPQRGATSSSRDRCSSSSSTRTPSRSNTTKAASSTPATRNETPPAHKEVQRKRNGSDRLLGLIGLQTSSARRLAHTKASNRPILTGAAPETRPTTRFSEPRASIPNTANRKTLSASFFQQRPSLVASSNGLATNSFQQANSALVGDFLNSEGPILVRDRRLAGVELNMIQYYQHPCVQVRKMPTANQPQQQRATPRRVCPASSTTNSSTNSTSSYEAAIKNSNTSLQHDSPEIRAVSSSSSSSSSSKQKQHLLSRPLPIPPALSSLNSSNGGSGSRSRATPVSTNLDLASLAPSKPSPTVTTCTSSGISSRLTAGPTASGQRVKSLSELHKQSKRRQLGQRQQQLQKGAPGAVQNELRRSSKQQTLKEPDSELSSSLKLFDENFSSKFADKQLASSNDSLLESINFNGTLNRKPVVANAAGSSS